MNQKNLVLWIVIVVIVLAIVAFWIYYSQNPQAYQGSTGYQTPVKSSDNATKIQADLNATDVSNLGSEVQAIDQTLAK